MGARQVDEETIRRWISENSPSPSSSYLVYAAKLITPVGSANPSATVFENTIGFGEWVNVGDSFYAASSNLEFTSSQVYIGGFPFDNDSGNTIFIPIYNNDQTIIGYYSFSFSSNEGLLDIDLGFKDGAMVTCNMDAIFTAGKPFYLPEVRIYPAT